MATDSKDVAQISNSTPVHLEVIGSAIGVSVTMLFTGYQFIAVPLGSLQSDVAVLSTRLDSLERSIEKLENKINKIESEEN